MAAAAAVAAGAGAGSGVGRPGALPRRPLQQQVKRRVSASPWVPGHSAQPGPGACCACDVTKGRAWALWNLRRLKVLVPHPPRVTSNVRRAACAGERGRGMQLWHWPHCPGEQVEQVLSSHPLPLPSLGGGGIMQLPGLKESILPL